MMLRKTAGLGLGFGVEKKMKRYLYYSNVLALPIRSSLRLAFVYF